MKKMQSLSLTSYMIYYFTFVINCFICQFRPGVTGWVILDTVLARTLDYGIGIRTDCVDW